MPGPLSAREREAFLAEPHVAVLSVPRAGGQPPHTTPIWYAYEPGGNLSFFTGTQGRPSRKSELLQEAGVLSLLVQRDEFPYRYVSIEGTVVQTDRPPASEQMLAVVRRYLPERQAQGFVRSELVTAGPSSNLVLFTVRPDRWLTFDFGDANG